MEFGASFTFVLLECLSFRGRHPLGMVFGGRRCVRVKTLCYGDLDIYTFASEYRGHIRLEQQYGNEFF